MKPDDFLLKPHHITDVTLVQGETHLVIELAHMTWSARLLRYDGNIFGLIRDENDEPLEGGHQIISWASVPAGISPPHLEAGAQQTADRAAPSMKRNDDRPAWPSDSKGNEILNRLVIGGLAGLSATAAMTLVMRLLHNRLPISLRYPLPPREIIQEAAPIDTEQALRVLTMLSHFGYGAATSALFTLATSERSLPAGATYGVGVWLASYLGWVPATRILIPATGHPFERNALMIAAHLVWGATMALVARELETATKQIFNDAGRPSPDRFRPRARRTRIRNKLKPPNRKKRDRR